MKTILCISAFLFFISNIISAQSLADTTLAITLKQKAKFFNKNLQYDSAIFYYQKEAETYSQILKNYQAKVLWKKYFIAINNQCTNIRNEFINLDRGIKILEKHIPLIKDILGNDNVLLSKLYYNIGYFNYYKFSFDQAEQYTNKCLYLRIKLLGEKSILTANAYSLLTHIYIDKKKYDKSLFCSQKAYEIRKKLYPKNLKYYLKFLSEKGYIYEYSGRFNLSLKSHLKALEVAKKLYGDNHFLMHNKFNNLGIAYYKLGNYDLGIEYLIKSLNLLKSNYPIKNRIVFIYINYIVDAYKRKGDYKTALNYCQKALYSALPHFNVSIDVYHNPESLENYYDGNYLLETLQYKAEILTKIGTPKDLKFALETYLLCCELIDKIKSGHFNERDKLALKRHSKKIYNEAVALCWKLAEGTELKAEKNKFYHQAFYFSEKSKASILLNSILSSYAKKIGNIPDSLLNKEDSLKKEKAIFQQKLLQVKDSSLKINFQDQIFSINRAFEKIIKNYELNYPNYYNLKHNKKTATLDEVQKFLKKEQSLIEYFVSDSSVYIFLIQNNTFKVVKSNSSNSLLTRIDNLNQSLEQKDKKAFANLSTALYQILIQPIEQDLSNDEIIIVNDGPLAFLSFEMLISELSIKELEFHKMSYLIEKHSFNYFNSATLFLQSKNDQKNNLDGYNCLAFSYSNEEKNNDNDGKIISMRNFRKSNLSDLPGSRKEIAAISKILEGDYYFGSYANENNFKTKSKDYNILHLALHGTVDNENPMNSKLFFTENDSINQNEIVEDNLLHAFELYNMKLNADLVVLSACNTGSGKLENGEGVMSLGRAFRYAGCKSVITSQWKLSDYSTPIIMKDFYSQLKEGQSKAKALQLAKLNYLKSGDNLTSNPFILGRLKNYW